MSTRLLALGTIAAALAGAALVVALVGGPVWLIAPGVLGAGVPALLRRVRRGQAPPDLVTPSTRLPGDPS